MSFLRCVNLFDACSARAAANSVGVIPRRSCKTPGIIILHKVQGKSARVHNRVGL